MVHGQVDENSGDFRKRIFAMRPLLISGCGLVVSNLAYLRFVRRHHVVFSVTAPTARRAKPGSLADSVTGGLYFFMRKRTVSVLHDRLQVITSLSDEQDPQYHGR